MNAVSLPQWLKGQSWHPSISAVLGATKKSSSDLSENLEHSGSGNNLHWFAHGWQWNNELGTASQQGQLDSLPTVIDTKDTQIEQGNQQPRDDSGASFCTVVAIDSPTYSLYYYYSASSKAEHRQSSIFPFTFWFLVENDTSHLNHCSHTGSCNNK